MNREPRHEVRGTETTTAAAAAAGLRKERQKDLNRLLKGIRVDFDDHDNLAKYPGAVKAADGFHVSNGVDVGLGVGNGNGNGNTGAEGDDFGSALGRGRGRLGPTAIVAIRPPY